MSNDSAPRRRPPRLVPAPEPVVTEPFAAQVRDAMAAQDEQGHWSQRGEERFAEDLARIRVAVEESPDVAPDVDLQGEQPELYGEWPHQRVAPFQGAYLNVVGALHAQVWATIFCQLLAHNGADNPGMVEFARAGAQDLADHAAGVYRFLDDGPV